ncbi:Protein of unknown function [Pyronema omphalodes CBS 100304]|uniref:Uncharacterized protein n=1 Tax=Pyronema omphalodes (strain CBS 100304) TaxID=1076935 RepID=U4KZI1_PYROM|nr:Protein of unknown function [Pyronema omphalodes CBS 100304]
MRGSRATTTCSPTGKSLYNRWFV